MKHGFKMSRCLRNIAIMAWVLSVFLTSICYAKHAHTEREYQTYWCNKRGGKMEYRLNDKTRIDCLLPTMAVEIDFAPKWHECIGQALYYGRKTNRTPACALIIENPTKDYKYVNRLRYAVYNKKKIPEFKTFTIKDYEY